MARIGKQNYPRLRQLIAEGLTAGEIGAALSVEPETVRKFARNRNLNIQRQPQHMENHPSWKNGTTKDRSGYVLQRVEKDGPYGYLIRALRPGDERGYAPIHRIVCHDKLGRPLLRNEVVHHVDGDTGNNAPENLEVFQNNGDHLATTLKGQIPNWSPAGFARITGRPPKNPRP